MAMEISQTLLAALSADRNIRTSAETTLKQFRDQNLPLYLLCLSAELANDQRPPGSRQLAGILLKYSVDAEDPDIKAYLTEQWVNMHIAVKSQIKNRLIQTLDSPVRVVTSIASQVVAKVASIEIPLNQWQSLITDLLGNMWYVGTPNIKRATVETLGYLCEDISPSHLEQHQVNDVLNAIVNGMKKSQHVYTVPLAAVCALHRALKFAQTNFENEMMRNEIMEVVCETARSENPNIRHAAFECLVSIASIYYRLLEPHMQTLFDLTTNAIKSDEEEVALQAIEFWSTVCEEEISMQGSSDLHYLVRNALPGLVPVLLETLRRPDRSMAGRTCLGLVAHTVGGTVVPLVMQFVKSNIITDDWRSHEAAIFAFGSLLEEPAFVEKFSPLIRQGMDAFLLSAIEDGGSDARDATIASTLSWIFAILLENVSDNVSEKLCRALYFLALGFENGIPALSVLTSCLRKITAFYFRQDELL